MPRDTTITLVFSEEVAENPDSRVTLTGPSGSVPLMILDSANQNTLTYRPSELLEAGGVYTVNFGGVHDLAGIP